MLTDWTTPCLDAETLAGLDEQEIRLGEGELLRQLIDEIEKLGYTNWYIFSRTMFGERDFAASAQTSDNLGTTNGGKMVSMIHFGVGINAV